MINSSTAVFAVADVKRTADHYCNVLGFKQHWLWGEPPTFGCVGLGKVELFLGQQPELAARIEGHGHFFAVDDLEAFHAQHAAAGAEIISPLENKPWGIREYTVRDINGYHLRFSGPQKYERPKTAQDVMPPNIHIEIALPTLDEYHALFKSVNWGIHSSMEEVLRRTMFAVLARDNGQVVGMTRVTGDGRCYMIWDVIVRPSHQGQKIGSALIEMALTELKRSAPRGAFVGLFTPKPEFYERLGFKKDVGMHQAL